ncbi:uncharacterized protein I303_107774 [Kwoniella dejecticola CBS 10117]|uniref:Uncharacterized protein n=1 Tax=Kwoniella dejecticola CBS 10117 TaxID=1296121 RepID=A0A1A5ZVN3_9TREE|nr:uncharacterized protein I303_07779 [Kwoniella dejecticola CBS 10117]OBR81869.1 hypothetical protein I303_07779 [Kwoniella dejecticola CBS 10117]
MNNIEPMWQNPNPQSWEAMQGFASITPPPDFRSRADHWESHSYQSGQSQNAAKIEAFVLSKPDSQGLSRTSHSSYQVDSSLPSDALTNRSFQPHPDGQPYPSPSLSGTSIHASSDLPYLCPSRLNSTDNLPVASSGHTAYCTLASPYGTMMGMQGFALPPACTGYLRWPLGSSSKRQRIDPTSDALTQDEDWEAVSLALEVLQARFVGAALNTDNLDQAQINLYSGKTGNVRATIANSLELADHLELIKPKDRWTFRASDVALERLSNTSQKDRQLLPYFDMNTGHPEPSGCTEVSFDEAFNEYDQEYFETNLHTHDQQGMDFISDDMLLYDTDIRLPTDSVLHDYTGLNPAFTPEEADSRLLGPLPSPDAASGTANDHFERLRSIDEMDASDASIIDTLHDVPRAASR